VPPTPVPPPRHPLERRRWNPRKGYDHLPCTHLDGAVTSGQQSTFPPTPPALCSHPRHYATIPSTAASSPALWELRSTGHRHAGRCAASGLPSAGPLNWHTDGGQTRVPAPLPSKPPGRAQDSPRRPPGARFARTNINSTTLCAMPLHEILRPARHDLETASPWSIKGGRGPLAARGGGG
jgi:hypothetical protein